MATIKLMLNKARRLNDGTYPLVMQIIHLRQKRVIYSKIYLHAEEFDPHNRTVIIHKVRHRPPKEIKALNRSIAEFQQSIEQIVYGYDRSGLSYTVHDVAQKYIVSHRGVSLCAYWRVKIEELKRLGRVGTAAAHLNTMRSVIRAQGTEDIGINAINAPLIQSYRRYLLACGVSLNTVAYYMRNFKAIVNCAVRDGVMSVPAVTIFDGVDTSPRKTVKRALTRDELRALVALDLRNETELELARDLFMFSFYARGMAFVDIAFLKKENLSGDTILYTRQKTGQLLKVGINEPIRLLIEKYSSFSRYILPTVDAAEPNAAYRQYRLALRKINFLLKIIGKRAGIATALTTYVARHSWATQAKERGASVTIISEGLGHTSEKITQIYLKDFDQSVLDNLNEQIVNL